MSTISPWLRSFQPPLTSSSSYSSRLICFAHAGGSPLFFRSWSKFLPETEIFVVALPGHVTRENETFFDDFSSLVSVITENLFSYLTPDTVFFGHSMGGVLAFEVIRELRRKQLPLPSGLIVSASAPPTFIRPPDSWRHLLPDHLLIEKIREYGSFAKEVSRFSHLLPMIRADLKLIETYQYLLEPPLEIPILVLGGNEDTVVSSDLLDDWKKQTTQKIEKILFKGDHFYLVANPIFFSFMKERMISFIK